MSSTPIFIGDVVYWRSPIGTWHRREHGDQNLVTVVELERALDLVAKSVATTDNSDQGDLFGGAS